MTGLGDDGIETITVLGSPGGVDDDGYPLPGGEDLDIPGCKVQLNVTSDDVARDRDGRSVSLRVLAPPGTVIDPDRQVRIRGQVFKVTGVPFDWSTNRRPALGRHRPKVEFIATRGEG